MSCITFDPTSCAGQILQNGLKTMAQSFVDGASWTVKTMTTAWLGVASPDLTSPASPVGWLQDRLSYFVLVAMFCSILFAAYRMATTGRFEHGAELGYSLLRLIAVSGCAGIVTTICLEVGDEFTRWLLAQTQVAFSGLVLTAAASQPAVLILLAIVVMVAQIAQLCLMLVKNAMVVALVAFLPLTSAATNTSIGKQGFQKAITWLGAFVLYKPVAAIIYVISFKLSAANQSITGQISGIALMVLAVFALPALMRFLVPAAAAVTGGNAGALAGAVVGATLATGAVIATGGASAGAGGFSGAAGPTGAIGGSGANASGATGALNAAASGASLGSSAAGSGNSTAGNGDDKTTGTP